MNGFLKNIAWFLIAILTVNFIYLNLIKHFDWNFVKTIEASQFRNQNFQCLVLGNSLAMDGIDAELLTNKGITTYNTALGGAGLKANLFQLTEYLKNNNKPEKVLLALSSCIDSDLDSETINPILDYSYGDYKFSMRNLPIWKFKWIAKELIKKLISADHRNAYLKSGQLRFERIVEEKSQYKDSIETKLNNSKYQRSVYLGKIDSLCAINKIQLIVIEMPGIKKTQNDIPVQNIPIQGYNGMNLQIINLNNREFCKRFEDQNDWLGNCHLNESGAKKLTEAVYESMKN